MNTYLVEPYPHSVVYYVDALDYLVDPETMYVFFIGDGGEFIASFFKPTLVLKQRDTDETNT